MSRLPPILRRQYGKTTTLGLALSAIGCAAAQPTAHRDECEPPPQRASSSDEAQKSSPPPDSRPEVVDSPYCLFGCPLSERPSSNRLLRREGFLLSNNPQSKFADWAAYRVTPSTIARSKRRDWEADPDLPEAETLEPEDFVGAHAALGTDRGHQVPLASLSGIEEWRALNFVSNLTPQRSELNRRLWNRLEQAERALVFDGAARIYVVTGPLYERDMPTLPAADEPHRIPSGYFKVIALPDEQNIVVASFIVQQETPGDESHCQHRVTVDEVEARALLDLFALLSDEQEASVEANPGTLYGRLGCE